MNDIKLMQQALEALTRIWEDGLENYPVWAHEAAIDNLRERLAQPEQEPVAWGCNRYIEDDNGFQIGTDEPELVWGKYAPDDNGWWPLYTAPPQRKPLTDEEIREIADKHLFYQPEGYEVSGVFALARAIEAAHGIKGEA